MAKRIIFKSRQRTVNPKPEHRRSNVVRLTDEAYDVIAEISLKTRMSMQQVASEAIMCIADNYEVIEEDDSE